MAGRVTSSLVLQTSAHRMELIIIALIAVEVVIVCTALLIAAFLLKLLPVSHPRRA